jgi:catalase
MPLNPPLRYDPSFEHVAEDEAQVIADLTAAMRTINQKTFDDSGHANRSVHAKAHALLIGEMTVLDGLPESLAQGIFAKPATYATVMRISTNPGDILDDHVSVPRGMALKVIGVEGPRLPGSESLTSQDFVMINAPAFAAPDAKGFLKTVKLLAGTTDKGEGLKRALSAVLRGAETALEAVGGKSGTLIALGGHPLTNPAGETFYTQVPLRHGPYMAKLSLAPVSPDLLALTGAKVDLKDKPDGLRDALVAFFATHGGEWEVRVQLCTDRETMPIEDASKVWPEDQSPYVAVARITVKPQSAYDETRHQVLDEAIAFSPWHGIEAHRPLGSVMRARQPAYEMSSGFRAEHNKCPIHDPRSAADIGV